MNGFKSTFAHDFIELRRIHFEEAAFGRDLDHLVIGVCVIVHKTFQVTVVFVTLSRTYSRHCLAAVHFTYY